MSDGGVIILIAVICVVAVLTILIAISKLLLISQPNEVIILSGSKRTLKSGDVVGFRVIRGGRALRKPFLEKASRMSLETIPIDLSITNAYSKGGIPLALDAIANIKIDSKEPTFGNAVERFLNMNEEEIKNIAKETLEGNLRGVLASLTPEEVNEDRMKFAESLMEEADIDLQKLGIQLDTLKITNISDESGYLDSIGRKKIAEVLANAKKAEAEKNAEASEAESYGLKRAENAKSKARQEIETVRILTEKNIAISMANKDAETNVAEALSEERSGKAQAQAKQEIEKAQVESEQNVFIARANKIAETRETEALSRERAEKANAKANQEVETAKISSVKNIAISKVQADQNVEIENNNLRVKVAELEKVAIIKEKEAEVAGEKAEVIFKQSVEEERIILMQKKLLADVIEPAKAKKEADELEAKGNSAKIFTDGQAKVDVLNMVVTAYLKAGDSGDKILMLNMLPQIIEQLASTIKGVNIDKISIIDSGGGNGSNNIAKLVNQLPGSVISLTEMIENATGVDILSIFKKDNDKPKEVEKEL